jgi:hypothetical protein
MCGKPVIMSTGMCLKLKLKSNGRSNEIWFKKSYFSILHYNRISNAYERCKSKGDVVNQKILEYKLVIPIILLVLKFQLPQWLCRLIIENTYIGQNFAGTRSCGFIRARGIKSNG